MRHAERSAAGWGTAHLQQLLEAEHLSHQHILLTAQLLPLQPLPLRLLVRLRQLSIKPTRDSTARSGTPISSISLRCQLPIPSLQGVCLQFSLCQDGIRGVCWEIAASRAWKIAPAR